MKIGLVPMAAKPYHVGHDMLLRLAAEENDKVHLFVSTADRENIRGSNMLKVWKKYIEPTMPKNVVVQYVEVPVSCVYRILEKAELIESNDEFAIYSDDKDILRYRTTSLKKSALNLFNKNKIILRGIKRTQTVQVCATHMRRALLAKDPATFISMLPINVRQYGKDIYDVLRG